MTKRYTIVVLLALLLYSTAYAQQTAPAGAIDAWGWVAVILIAGAVWYFYFRK